GPAVQSPLRDLDEGFADDGAAHLGLAELPFGEGDGHLQDAEALLIGAPGEIDLEAIALRGDGAQGQGLQDAPAIRPESGRDVGNGHAERDLGVQIRHAGQQLPVQRPVDERTAGHIPGADDEVGVAERVEHPRQVLGRVGAVRVHLDHGGVVTLERPTESGDVSGAESGLLRAVEDVDAVVVGREFVRYLTGTVRAAVVDHEYVDLRQHRVQPTYERWEIVPLVVGWDAHQHRVDVIRVLCPLRHAAPLLSRLLALRSSSCATGARTRRPWRRARPRPARTRSTHRVDPTA